MQNPAADAVVRQMRDAIIDNDVKLLAAVNARLELVARLRSYKRSQGMEFVDQAREDWMHRLPSPRRTRARSATRGCTRSKAPST